MGSIRLFLVIVSLAVICLANFLAVLHGYQESLRASAQQLDQTLAERSVMLGKLLKHPELLDGDLFPPDQWVQVWKNGVITYRSDNAPQTSISGNQHGYHFGSFNGIRWRMLIMENNSVVNSSSANTTKTLLVAQNYSVYIKPIEDMMIKGLAPIIWILPLLGVLIWIIIYLGLRPLGNLAKRLTHRKVSDFSAINAENFPQELSVLVRSLNDMLARLSAAFERELHFTGDAAHELRTPLSALKIGLQNLRIEASEQNQTWRKETLQNLEASTEKMSQMITQLLDLYRLTPEIFTRSLHCFDIKELIQNEIVDIYPKLADKDQSIALSGDNILIEAEEFAIKTVIRNLIDNASKYCPPTSKIKIRLKVDADMALLTIEDSGPGIAESEYTRVFDRFYRVGGDQHASQQPGSGLGLAIVQHAIKLHNGTIELGKSDILGGLRIRIHLPLKQSTQNQSL